MVEQHSAKRRVIAAFFYGFSSVAIMTVNKTVLTSYKFPSEAFVGLMQMVLTVVILYTLKTLRLVSFPPCERAIIRKVFPLPLLYLGNLLTGLVGTKRINLPMFTLLRRFSILFTMLAEKWILGVQASTTVQVSVALMLGGALVAAADDLAFDMTGYVFIMANNVLTAAQGVYLKQKLDSKELGNNGLMYYNCLFSIPIACALVLSDSQKLQQIVDFPHWSDPQFVMYFVATCVMGLVLTYSMFECTHVNSALTTTVIGCLKNIIVAYVGMMMADYIFTVQNFAGINISIFGSLLYSYYTFKKPSPPKDQGDGSKGVLPTKQ